MVFKKRINNVVFVLWLFGEGTVKRKIIGISIGILLTLFIIFLISYLIGSEMLGKIHNPWEWYLSYLVRTGIGFFFMGILINFITKTKATSSLVKESVISCGVGTVLSIAFFSLFSLIFLPYFIIVSALGAYVHSGRFTSDLKHKKKASSILVISILFVLLFFFAMMNLDTSYPRGEQYSPSLYFDTNLTTGIMTVYYASNSIHINWEDIQFIVTYANGTRIEFINESYHSHCGENDKCIDHGLSGEIVNGDAISMKNICGVGTFSVVAIYLNTNIALFEYDFDIT